MDTTLPIQYPFRPLLPEELLGANTFYRIEPGQLIFYYQPWEQYVITTIDSTQTYALQAFEALPEGAPYQLINGNLVYIPAPALIHQEVLSNINRQVDNLVYRHKLGKVLFAPVDVQLSDKDVLQPDLIYISVARNAIRKNCLVLKKVYDGQVVLIFKQLVVKKTPTALALASGRNHNGGVGL